MLLPWEERRDRNGNVLQAGMSLIYLGMGGASCPALGAPVPHTAGLLPYACTRMRSIFPGS